MTRNLCLFLLWLCSFSVHTTIKRWLSAHQFMMRLEQLIYTNMYTRAHLHTQKENKTYSPVQNNSHHFSPLYGLRWIYRVDISLIISLQNYSKSWKNAVLHVYWCMYQVEILNHIMMCHLSRNSFINRIQLVIPLVILWTYRYRRFTQVI